VLNPNAKDRSLKWRFSSIYRRRGTGHLNAEIEAPRVEILEAQANRGVTLRRNEQQRETERARQNPEGPRPEEHGRGSAHLEVAGLAGVEDLAGEVAQLAEGEEEAVAEERGERGHVREPHHPPFPLPVSGWMRRRPRICCRDFALPRRGSEQKRSSMATSVVAWRLVN
jgi:hypothetical protein